MAFTESTTLSYTPSQVFAGLISQDFQHYVATELGVTLQEFNVSPTEPAATDTVAVTIERSVDSARVAHRLPQALQRFVQGPIRVSQSEAWSAAGDDGARAANVTIQVPLAKATGTATMKLTGAADGSATVVDIAGSVKSSIPLMGSKIASMAEVQVGRLLTEMTKKLADWLDQQ